MSLQVTLKGIAVLGVLILAAPLIAQETNLLKTHQDRISYVAGVEMATSLKTQGKDKISQAAGVEMAASLKAQGVEVALDLFIKGVQDTFTGGKLLLSDDDLRKASGMFHAELRRKRNETREKQAMAVRMESEDNKKKGEAFLAENRTKEGVVTLPSGLQYRILKAGEGRKPTDADTVEVNYRGAHINGTQFDASPAGKPATLKVSGVIPGWKEALKLMPVGSKWQLFIPPQLAYGARGAPPVIGPNATLIFEVELVAIK